MGKGAEIVIAGSGFHGATITRNRITGSGAHGIYVASPKRPNEGKHVIHGNIVSGYDKALFVDLALHAGTVLSGKK